MDYDLENCNPVGIIMGADDITLDCNGHVIDGDSDFPVGVVINAFTQTTIKNCIFDQIHTGVSLSYADNNLVEQNVFTNGNVGVLVDSSENVQLSENIFTGNLIGAHISMEDRGKAIVIKNRFVSNTVYGIIVDILGSSNESNGSHGTNIFYENVFLNNGINAYEELTVQSNQWDDGFSIGNEWDDFTTNPGYPNEYQIPGPGDGIDYFPNQSGNEICDDGIDNDGDGDVDCEDIDCLGHPYCQFNEVCDDNIDNDNDGLIDCEDLIDCGGLCINTLNQEVDSLEQKDVELEQVDISIWKKINQIWDCLFKKVCVLK